MLVDKLIDAVLVKEGGYVNHPNDRGGPTNFGITQAVARTQGFMGDMRNLTRAEARDIYWRLYVLKPQFDKVAALSDVIAAELVDTGVNMGPATATKILQRSLNLLNRQQGDFADIAMDGMNGPGTLGALTKYLKVRGLEGERRLLKLLNALQGSRYADIAEKTPSQEAFMFGWLDRI